MSTSGKKPSKAAALAGVQAMIAGIQKHFPNGSLTIGSATFATASLVETLQGLVDSMTKQNAAEQAAKDALTALRAEKARVNPVVQGLRALILATYGDATQTLADFGLVPRKARTPLTVEQKAARQAKAQATRKARGTTGPKAKLAIKGTVAATTPVAPAPPAPKPAG